MSSFLEKIIKETIENKEEKESKEFKFIEYGRLKVVDYE